MKPYYENENGNGNEGKTILHLCADIGSDSKFYKDNGYNVVCIGKDIGVENYTPPKKVYGIIANPVCTDFSIAREGFLFGTKKKQNIDTEKGLFLVNHCIRIIYEANPHFFYIENPATGKLKNFLGRPDMTFEPWNFGDPWTKRAALWGKFNKPEVVYKKWEDVPKNNKLYIRPGRPKPSMAFLHKSAGRNIPSLSKFNCKSDMDFRSLCPQGFSESFFNSNR